jgi:ubiquinone/menaquinone biosynthesis C-methylase UbiE
MSIYFESIRSRMPHFFQGVDVLEYSPHDTSKRFMSLFKDSRYHVLDPRHNDLSGIKDSNFNVVISVDYLQYTPNYLDILTRMHRVSSKFVMFSCAAAGKRVDNPPVYYKNLVMSDFYNQLDLDSMFETYKFYVDYENSELCFWGVNKLKSEV